MKGILIKNKYYRDDGLDYVFKRLDEEFARLRVKLTQTYVEAAYDEGGNYILPPLNADFALFWDKDFRVSRALEKRMRVFNSTACLMRCDDKENTYAALVGSGIAIPPTIPAPLVFAVNDGEDENLLLRAESAFGYPLLVKANVGSLGQQVHMATQRQELAALHRKYMYQPHHLQKCVGKMGEDVRLYLLGGRVIAACRRTNTLSYKANIAGGGSMQLFTPAANFVDAAEKAAKLLDMDYGSIDFASYPEPIFIEANSNAYFRAIESLGVDIAGPYARFVCEVL